MGEEIYNRFPAKESILYKEKILNRPIVNEHIELLWSWINNMNLGYERKRWWEEMEFAAVVTHDVDSVFKYRNIKNTLGLILNNIKNDKSVGKAAKTSIGYIRRKLSYKTDPFYSFDDILNIEAENKIKSTFYFMTGGTSNHENYYKINDYKVVDLVKKIEKNKCEVGLHCSFNSYNDLELMREEKARLDLVKNPGECGCRQHFLRFRAPYTWRIHEELGFKYDTTLGFADKEGFRAGTCFPFKPYDILEDRIIDLWEIPLIVMEGSLDNEKYSNYSPEEGYNKTIEIIECVRKYNGVFTLLWHNSSLDRESVKLSKWIPIYKDIMGYLGNCNLKNYRGIDMAKLLEESIK